MRILFLTTDLSYPPADGRMLRTYNVLKGLASRHAVNLVAFDQRHGIDPRERRRVAEARLREICESVDVFEIPAKRSRLGLYLTAATSLLRAEPFSCRAYRSVSASRKLHAILTDHSVDVLHVENTLLGGQVTDTSASARVLVHHNVESDLLDQRAASDHVLLRRVLASWEARKLREFESRMGPRFGVHIACSAEDARRLGTIMEGARVCVVPNGVDLDHFKAASSPRNRPPQVVHVGGLNWAPNLQGARWLVDDVWPRVRRAVPEASLVLVGRMGAAPVDQWETRPGVVCQGEVEDVRPHFASAAVSVVPLHIGGGTRLKILNSWAMATPVVSTTKGCEGLPAKDGENLLIGNTPADFAAAVVKLLATPELRVALATEGRRLVEAEFGWDRIVERTEQAYRRASDHRVVRAES